MESRQTPALINCDTIATSYDNHKKFFFLSSLLSSQRLHDIHSFSNFIPLLRTDRVVKSPFENYRKLLLLIPHFVSVLALAISWFRYSWTYLSISFQPFMFLFCPAFLFSSVSICHLGLVQEVIFVYLSLLSLPGLLSRSGPFLWLLVTFHNPLESTGYYF